MLIINYILYIYTHVLFFQYSFVNTEKRLNYFYSQWKLLLTSLSHTCVMSTPCNQLTPRNQQYEIRWNISNSLNFSPTFGYSNKLLNFIQLFSVNLFHSLSCLLFLYLKYNLHFRCFIEVYRTMRCWQHKNCKEIMLNVALTTLFPYMCKSSSFL